MPYYAVAKGKQTIINKNCVYKNCCTDACRENMNGYSGACFKKFDTQAECQQFISNNSESSSSSNGFSSGSYSGGGYVALPGPSRSYSGAAAQGKRSCGGRINVWTDGSCPGNGRNATAAGRGVYFDDNHPWNVTERADGPRLDRELDGTIDVKWQHVPGHSGNYGNVQADKLARKGATK
ncbi:uncharacterized protein LOC132256155 [Phlebotomus argentipes]|uniref:uncharacterized protein LOC132256155 n=1 Tax=Phlebotomus argentipes TaxID=94469 RepID=UPI002892B7DE|nr:uncharacterized protein LOC132256155 [Phlebotomus argentipes]